MAMIAVVPLLKSFVSLRVPQLSPNVVLMFPDLRRSPYFCRRRIRRHNAMLQQLIYI